MLRHVLSDMTSRAVYSTIQDERDLLSEQRDFRLVFFVLPVCAFACYLLFVCHVLLPIKQNVQLFSFVFGLSRGHKTEMCANVQQSCANTLLNRCRRGGRSSCSI